MAMLPRLRLRPRPHRPQAARLSAIVLAGLVLGAVGGSAPAAGAPYASDHVVVKLVASASARADAAGLGVGGDVPVGPGLRVLRVAGRSSVAATLNRLRRRGDVRYAVADYVAHASSAGYVPDDPGRGVPGDWQALQWNFVGPWGLDAPDAWANLRAAGAPGGLGVTVAVLDTGVAYANHGRFRRSPDFSAPQFRRGYDFVAHDSHPDDRNGHGTHVAGTIAEATNNGIGLTGLAYGVRLMPVRVLNAQGDGDASAIAAGVRFAVNHGAQVINLSLEFSRDITRHDIPELLDALVYAHRRGVLVVGASGNEGRASVAYPARARFVVAVGATTEHGCLSDFSNGGRRLDLVAPGGGADANLPGDPRCQPLQPPGRDIYQVTFAGSDPRRFGIPSGYEGTSMAAPHVAATAALIIASRVLGAHPTPDALLVRLRATARQLGPPGPRAYSRYYGWGEINAAAATAPASPTPTAGASPGA